MTRTQSETSGEDRGTPDPDEQGGVPVPRVLEAPEANLTESDLGSERHGDVVYNPEVKPNFNLTPQLQSKLRINSIDPNSPFLILNP